MPLKGKLELNSVFPPYLQYNIPSRKQLQELQKWLLQGGQCARNATHKLSPLRSPASASQETSTWSHTSQDQYLQNQRDLGGKRRPEPSLTPGKNTQREEKQKKCEVSLQASEMKESPPVPHAGRQG